MLAVLLIPVLRGLFSITLLPLDKLLETIILIFSPIIFVEIFKLLKINTINE